MKPVINNNLKINQLIRKNFESTILKKEDIIRAKIQNISDNGISIKLSNGQSLFARVDGQWTFELEEWVCFEILEWTSQIIKLRPVDNTALNGINQISQYLEMLGLAKTPENEAILYFMFIQGIPLNKENILFFMNKRFKLSRAIRLLLLEAKRQGMGEYAQTLDGKLLRLETLSLFLKNPSFNIKTLYHEIINLCEKFTEKDIHGELRHIIKDVYTGIFLQTNENIPFRMVQIPIKINDHLLDSEIWYDKKKDIFYMEIDLPHLGTTGCLLKNWKSKASVDFYCAPDYCHFIKKGIGTLKRTLTDIGIRVEKIEVHNIFKEHGLRNFLKPYWNEREIIDIKV